MTSYSFDNDNIIKESDNMNVAKMLSDSGDEFDDIELSNCIGFVSIVECCSKCGQEIH